MHTSCSLKGRMSRQKGHLKSATTPGVEVATPLWMNLSQKLRSSAGPRRRCEHRRVHSGQSRRRQQLVLLEHDLATGVHLAASLVFSGACASGGIYASSSCGGGFMCKCGEWPCAALFGRALKRHAAAAGIGCCGSGQMESLPKVLGGSYGGGLSKMDRDAGLRPASAYQRLDPWMSALSAK